MKKKLLLFLSFTIFLFITCNMSGSFISTHIYAPAYATTATTAEKQIKTQGEKDINQISIPQKNSYTLSHLEKTGFKYKIFKFLLSMLGVLISSIAIFIGLKIYKKFILKNNIKSYNIDYNKNLESPKNFKEAINLFLNKTDE